MYNFKEWLVLDKISAETCNLISSAEKELILIEFLRQFGAYTGVLLENDDAEQDVEELDPSNLTDSQRSYARRLRDNALWIRWHAMLERKYDIERLRKLAKDYEKEEPQEAIRIKNGRHSEEEEESNEDDHVEESVFLDDEDDDNDNTGSVSPPPSHSFNTDEVKELLIKLGYLKEKKLDKIYDERKKRDQILKAMYKAIGEVGNEIPKDIDPSELIVPELDKDGKEITDRWGRPKTKPSEKIAEAKKRLMSDLYGLEPDTPDATPTPDIFRKTFEKVFQRDSGSFTNSSGASVRGNKNFESPEDVASDFVSQIMSMLTKRKGSRDWGPFHKDHKDLGSSRSDLEGDQFVSSILNSWRHRIGNIAKTAVHQRRVAFAPAPRAKDEVTQRSEVNSLLGKDLEKARKALYQVPAMLKKPDPEQGSWPPGTPEFAAVAAKLRVTPKELEEMVANPLHSLQFHVNYLKAMRNGTQRSITANNTEDKHRLELMKQIEALGTRPGMSTDPNKIFDTLENYRMHYAYKRSQAPIFAGSYGAKGDDMEDMWATHIGLVDDKADSGIFAGKKGGEIPGVSNSETETRKKLLEDLHEAIKKLSQNGKQDLPAIRRTGFWQALAVCIKLGLPFNGETGESWASFATVEDDVVDAFFAQPVKTPQSGKKVRKVRKDCFQHLNSIGTMQMTPSRKAGSNESLHEKLKAIGIRLRGPGAWKDGGGEITTASTNQYLTDGLKFICDYLKSKNSSMS